MSQGGVSGDNFRPADNNPGVRLFLQLDIDVFHFVGRFVAVNGRVDDSMVKVQAGLLNAGVPVAGVLLKLAVEGWVSAQSAAKGGFVIRCASHPAVTQA
ncbi:Uncharacterised protein [Salmonella enterica subsp. enterica serovar Bovismorbificans]|nr:Uncharacterised protein [Salmonella enterica subsp. enterica serovar Bovismorbificans]